jgi:hypothetical protein
MAVTDDRAVAGRDMPALTTGPETWRATFELHPMKSLCTEQNL